MFRFPSNIAWLAIWLIPAMLSAQPEVGFLHATDTLFVGANERNYLHFIPVRINAPVSDSQEIIVHVHDMGQSAGFSSVYRFESQTLRFAADAPLQQTIQIEVIGGSSALLHRPVHLILEIQQGNARLSQDRIMLFFHSLQTSDPAFLLSSHTFRLSLGANFDFIDGLKLNSHYADVTAFLPTLLPNHPHRSPFGSRWGMHIYLYQNRSTSTVINRGKPSFADSSSYAHQQLDRLGLQVSPTFRITGTASLYQPFQLYGFLHAEFLQERSRLQTIDPLFTDPEFDPPPLPGQEEVSFRPYLGTGLLLRYQTKDLDFIVRQSAGYAGNRLLCPEPPSNTLNYCEGPYHPQWFYMTQVYLMEKQVGIKLGMEMRGHFLWKKPEYLLSRHLTPTFTVFLAKEVSFSQIGKLFDSIGGL